MNTLICPNCGEIISERDKSCPHCGSDENTGWSNEAYLNRLGVSSYDEEIYQETVQKEFGGEKRHTSLKKLIFTITALIMILLFIFYFVC